MSGYDRNAPCPRHERRGGRLRDCPWCEAEFARQELELEDPPPDGGRVDEIAFERWLDEIGGSA